MYNCNGRPTTNPIHGYANEKMLYMDNLEKRVQTQKSRREYY